MAILGARGTFLFFFHGKLLNAKTLKVLNTASLVIVNRQDIMTWWWLISWPVVFLKYAGQLHHNVTVP